MHATNIYRLLTISRPYSNQQRLKTVKKTDKIFALMELTFWEHRIGNTIYTNVSQGIVHKNGQI